MDEKKSKGISVSGFFLIIAIIVIIAMGYFIYKFYNDKTTEIQRADDLQAEVDRLNGTLNELQEKVANISETINTFNESNGIVKDVSNNSNSNESELSDEFIKNEFETAWSIFKKSYDIFQYDAYNDSIDLPVEGQKYTWKYYKITNFDDIINKYISSSYSNLVDNMDIIIVKNNNYYIMDSTDGTSLDRIDEINILEKSNDRILCEVKIHIASYTGLDSETALEENYKFELVKENDTWKISKFELSE